MPSAVTLNVLPVDVGDGIAVFDVAHDLIGGVEVAEIAVGRGNDQWVDRQFDVRPVRIRTAEGLLEQNVEAAVNARIVGSGQDRR